MHVFNCTSIIIFTLALFGLTGAVNLPASTTQRRNASPQKAYTCQGWNDYGELTQNGLNGTKCDCAGVSALQTPETIRNITNFSDPAQCTDYVLISARGTLEPEGLSIGFLGMTFGTLEQVPNGAFYAVRYPAGVDQNTTLGVRDVVNSITQGLTACPNRRYALYGASQGATVILRALPEFTQSMFDSVKAIILVGSPFRAPGKQSNVDGFGRRTEKSTAATGVFYGDSDSVELSKQWDQSGKVLDICRDGDGVCDSKQACSGATLTHMTYGISQNVQTLGIRHVVGRLLGKAPAQQA